MCGVMPPLNHTSERRDAQLSTGGGGKSLPSAKVSPRHCYFCDIYKAHAAVFLGIKVFWDTRLCR